MIYQFDQFELDIARFELREEGVVQPLEPQVFTLLAYLVEHRERLVAKNELFEKLWGGRVVTDSALTSRIKSARQVLGDSGKAQQFIKTIHGKGFRFVADVRFARSMSKVLPGDGTERPDAAIELIIELERLRWLLVFALGRSCTQCLNQGESCSVPSHLPATLNPASASVSLKPGVMPEI